MVITQSAEPVVLLDGVGVLSVPVPPIAEDEVKDTTGAGDAVVGGFLAGRFLGKTLEESIR